MTIGTYEVPIWGKKGWLVPLDDLGADYDVDDLLPAIRGGLSVDGKLYAAPFYGESSMLMYRKDLVDKAGMKMPDAPTWDVIAEAARKMTDKANGIYGICLRGKAGWGENMAFLTATANSFGARWFDENWKPQFDQPDWKKTLNFYVDLMKDDGPPGRLLQRLQREPGAVPARQVRHVDRRHGRGLLRHRPEGVEGRRQGRLRAGAGQWPRQARQLAVGLVAGDPGRLARRPRPRRSSSPGRPRKDYIELVAAKEGWANVPPGTRTSLYANPEYLKAAPFAKMTLDSDQRGRPDQSDRRAGALRRRAVRRDPRVPGHRHRRSASIFSAALAGTDDRRSRRSPQRASDDDRARLHQVTARPATSSNRAPPAA